MTEAFEEKEVSLLSTDEGNIVFSPDVVATIAGVAANSVEGVAGMSGSFVDGLAGVFGSKNHKKGVKAELGKIETAINANIIIKYGSRVNDVCDKVQRAIKDAVENMTGLCVVAVNVNVSDVAFENEKKEKNDKKQSTQNFSSTLR